MKVTLSNHEIEGIVNDYIWGNPEKFGAEDLHWTSTKYDYDSITVEIDYEDSTVRNIRKAIKELENNL